MRLVALIVASIAAFGACRSGDAAPSCGAVAGNFVQIASTALHGLPPDQLPDAARRSILDQLPAMRDSLDHACTDTRWSAAVRTCLARAVDHVAFQACEDQLTEEQRRALAP